MGATKRSQWLNAQQTTVHLICKPLSNMQDACQCISFSNCEIRKRFGSWYNSVLSGLVLILLALYRAISMTSLTADVRAMQ
jgi:hypothetical protein